MIDWVLDHASIVSMSTSSFLIGVVLMAVWQLFGSTRPLSRLHRVVLASTIAVAIPLVILTSVGAFLIDWLVDCLRTPGPC